MTDGIESVTRSALAMALDAASLRQQAIATNIANANAIGYVPQRVSFEDQLADARRGLAQSGRLDAEAADMARNAVHYQALVKGLSRHFAILSMAAGDGRK